MTNKTPAAAAALAAIRAARPTTTPAPAYSNPYLRVALDRAHQAYGGGTTAQDAADLSYEVWATREEYRHADGPRPCECGGTLHYRATVGAWSCPTCGLVQTAAGKNLR